MKRFLFCLMTLLLFPVFPAEETRIIYTELFSGVSHPMEFPGKLRAKWKKQHPKASIPGPYTFPSPGWGIRWADLPEKAAAVCEKRTFRIHSGKPGITLYSPTVIHTCGTHEAEIAVSGNGTIRMALQDTADQSGERIQWTEFKFNTPISKGKKKPELKTFSLKRSVASRGNWVRCVFCVEGNVTLHQLILRERRNPAVILAEGTVVDRSNLPDPKRFGYPDSNYIVHFRGEQILAGPSCPRELQLVMPGFVKFKYTDSAKLKKGDRIRVSLAPPSLMNEQQKAVNQADDLTLFHLDMYYVLSCQTIKNWAKTQSYSITPFSDTVPSWRSILDRELNPPIPEELRLLQQDAIRTELARMNSIVTWYEEDAPLWNRKFPPLWKAEFAKDTKGWNRTGGKVWRRINGSLWALPEKFRPFDNNELTGPWNMEAILAFQEMLNRNGIQLIVQIMPDYYDMAARVMIPAFRSVPDYRCARIVKQFLEAGIETYYTSDLLMNRYNLHECMFFYPTDAHPADTCQELCTDQMVRVLERYHFPKTAEESDFRRETAPYRKNGNINYQYPKSCDNGSETGGTMRKGLKILMNGKNSVPSDPAAPVLFVGNSFMNTPSQANYSKHITMKGRYKIHYTTLAWQGPFTTIFRNIFMNPETYLKGKKVVVIPVGVTSMQNAISWYNVKRMDRYSQYLSGKKVQQTVWITSPLPEEENHRIRNRFLNRSNRSYWEAFSDRKEFLVKRKVPVRATEVSLKGLDPAKPAACLVPCIAPVGSKLRIRVNGELCENIPESPSRPCWENLVFSLPPGTSRLKLELLTERSEAFVALKDILVYQ